MKSKKDKEKEKFDKEFQEAVSFEKMVKFFATTTNEDYLREGHKMFKALLPPTIYDLLLRSENLYRELYLENQELKRQLGVV